MFFQGKCDFVSKKGLIAAAKIILSLYLFTRAESTMMLALDNRNKGYQSLYIALPFGSWALYHESKLLLSRLSPLYKPLKRYISRVLILDISEDFV